MVVIMGFLGMALSAMLFGISEEMVAVRKSASNDDPDLPDDQITPLDDLLVPHDDPQS